MKRKCSVCKEKGHDKRQCPIQREKIQEEITFRRERLNLFFAKAPELLNNPVLMGLLWYRISRNNPLLSTANTLIITGDIGGLNVPHGATLGAIIQKAETTNEYIEKIKGTGQEEARALGGSGAVRFFEEGSKFLFAEESPFPEYDPVTGEKYGETIE